MLNSFALLRIAANLKLGMYFFWRECVILVQAWENVLSLSKHKKCIILVEAWERSKCCNALRKQERESRFWRLPRIDQKEGRFQNNCQKEESSKNMLKERIFQEFAKRREFSRNLHICGCPGRQVGRSEVDHTCPKISFFSNSVRHLSKNPFLLKFSQTLVQ